MMESYESQELNTEGLDVAFLNTYRLVTGKSKIDNFAVAGNETHYILYDPFSLDVSELTDILNDIIDYFIETEEYEKCQELKNLLDSGKKGLTKLIKEITLDNTYSDYIPPKIKDTNRQGLNSIDNLISLFKQYRTNFESNESSTWKMGKDKKYIPESLTTVEMWSLMKDNDKNIFEGDYTSFKKWFENLDIKNQKYYSERLIHDLPLVPLLDDEVYNSFQKRYDYNNMVVTVIGEYICISNYDSEKISRLQTIIEKLGIVDSEIRIKEDLDGKVIYTLVYSSNQPPQQS